ncbi:MAG: phosphate ABC transporter substrate-binding protein PstS [Labilithrix sp.]|nr:phosphate ABC transporter substrate-binding protein PstS [Labilithrix sp.]
MTRRLALFALFVVVAIACTRGAPPSEASPRALVGAGATLPYPLYSKWSAEYQRVEPRVRINYQSIGSGAGIRQISDGVVDFGATDEPTSTPANMVLVPTTIGAVVIAFNLPGVKELALTPELIADIFLGKVARWDHERVRAVNQGRALPSEPITVVHRADGSGTSAALTTFLAKRSAAWRDVVGAGSSPRFPVGVGAKGNEGVTAFVKATPLSVGYVELAYAKQSGLAMAEVQNRAGKLVAPSLGALERAAKSFADPTSEVGPVSLVDSADEGAYPITALSFVVVPLEASDRTKAEALAKFLWWAIHDGQDLASALEYAPLPPALVRRGERALRELRAAGHPLLPGTG